MAGLPFLTLPTPIRPFTLRASSLVSVDFGSLQARHLSAAIDLPEAVRGSVQL